MTISVIIPAYNCSDTLEAAVNSVMISAAESNAEIIKSASFSNEKSESALSYSVLKEIIIIDDGSVDSTPAVILSLKEKYPIIKSIRTKNGGPARARNLGIKESSGDYIMFLDSDDTYEKETLKKISAFLGENTDLLIFGFRQRFYGRANDKTYSPETQFDTASFYKNNLLNQVWNKVYKTDFIKTNNIVFKDYKYGEDRIFNADVLERAPNVKAIPDILYNYNIDKSVSLISGYIPEKFSACTEINSKFSELCGDKSVTDYMFIKSVLSCMTVLFAENCRLTHSQKLSEIKKVINHESVSETAENRQDSLYMEIIRRIIKTKSVRLNFLLAFAVSLCQKNLLPLFIKFRG